MKVARNYLIKVKLSVQCIIYNVHVNKEYFINNHSLFPVWFESVVTAKKLLTVCPRSGDPFYIITYYIKWVTASWTYSKIRHVIFVVDFF